MSHKDLIPLLEASPFVPFRIHLTDGKTYDVQHRDFVWVFPTRLEIATPSKDSERLMERADLVSLLHIVRLEPIDQATTAPAQDEPGASGGPPP
jgi:hypothetical protein